MGQRGRSRGRRTLAVGLTGQIASGKSTALKAFKKRGWAVLSSDEVVEEIYEEKGLDKERLRKECARSPQKLKKLEKWVHPLVRKRINSFMKKSKKPVIVEVPLLLETGFDKLFNLTVFVYAPKAERLKRVLKRGMSRKLFESLERKQWSAQDKAAASDFILHNLSKPGLKKQVKALSKFLLLGI